MSHRHRGRGHALGGGERQHHRIFPPRLAGLGVANASPQIDDLFAAVIDTNRGADLTAALEVAGKLLLDGLEPRSDETVDMHGLG